MKGRPNQVEVGPGRLAHPIRATVRRGSPQGREVGWEKDHSREGLIESKEATTSGVGCRGPATTPQEEKEDTVGSVTMINSTMLSALMGVNFSFVHGFVNDRVM
jgi:hypothetical protein